MGLIMGASQTLAVVASDVALVVEWLLAPVVGWLLLHMWVCSPTAVRIGVLVGFFLRKAVHIHASMYGTMELGTIANNGKNCNATVVTCGAKCASI